MNFKNKGRVLDNPLLRCEENMDLNQNEKGAKEVTLEICQFQIRMCTSERKLSNRQKDARGDS